MKTEFEVVKNRVQEISVLNVVPKLNILMLAICGKVLVMVTIGISGRERLKTLLTC